MGYEAAFQLRGYTYFGRSYPHKASRWMNGRGHPGATAFVIGNGESRLNVDLWKLQREFPQAIFLACNSYFEDALNHVEPIPTYLGAVDQAITTHILDSGYAEDHWFLCTVQNLSTIAGERGKLEAPNHLIEWDYNANFNCGVEMMQFAAVCGCKNIFLLGFDGPGKVTNNVYKDRDVCFASPTTPEPGLWQSRMVMKRFTEPNYYQVGTEWLQPVETISFDDFEERAREVSRDLARDL